jgi:hypothetical protein
MDTRKVTNQLLDMMDDGLLDPRQVAQDLLGFLSEDEVQDFAETNDYPITIDEDE